MSDTMKTAQELVLKADSHNNIARKFAALARISNALFGRMLTLLQEETDQGKITMDMLKLVTKTRDYYIEQAEFFNSSAQKLYELHQLL